MQIQRVTLSLNRHHYATNTCEYQEAVSPGPQDSEGRCQTATHVAAEFSIVNLQIPATAGGQRSLKDGVE